MDFNEYMKDGANRQARAVLALMECDGIDALWSKEHGCYRVQPKVARWENCREQGYVVFLPLAQKQLCIAFFEHRNSDDIVAVRWEQDRTINAPNLDTAKFEDVYKDKWSVSHSVGYGRADLMAQWVWKELETYAQQFMADNPNKAVL